MRLEEAFIDELEKIAKEREKAGLLSHATTLAAALAGGRLAGGRFERPKKGTWKGKIGRTAAGGAAGGLLGSIAASKLKDVLKRRKKKKKKKSK